MAFHGLHLLAVFAGGLAFNAEHARLAGAVDVGVEHPNRGPFLGQGQSQIDRGRGLSDTALARGHGNDVLDAVQQFHAPLGLVGTNMLSNFHLRPLTSKLLHRCRNFLSDLLCDALSGIGQFDPDLLPFNGLEHPGAGEILAQIGILNLRKGLLDLLLL